MNCKIEELMKKRKKETKIFQLLAETGSHYTTFCTYHNLQATLKYLLTRKANG